MTDAAPAADPSGQRARAPAGAAVAATIGALLAVAAPAKALTIIPVFDSSITSLSNASTVEAAFNAAATKLDSEFSNGATVKIGVSWGSVYGRTLGTGNIGGSYDPFYTALSYSALVTDFTNRAKANPSDTVLASVAAHFPKSDPTKLNKFEIPTAEAQALGLAASKLSGNSGYVGFGSSTKWDFNPADGVTTGYFDFEGMAAHEMAEVLGRITGLYTSTPTWATPIDAMRYAAPGVANFSYSNAAYFSIDGGKTNLGAFNVSGGGDRSDWQLVSGSKDLQNASVYSEMVLSLTAADLTFLDAMGWGAPLAGSTSPLAQPGGTGGVAGFGDGVPEPSNWSLMLLGLGLAGMTLRRRRAAARAG
jgi:hypothetical protein